MAVTKAVGVSGKPLALVEGKENKDGVQGTHPVGPQPSGSCFPTCISVPWGPLDPAGTILLCFSPLLDSFVTFICSPYLSFSSALHDLLYCSVSLAKSPDPWLILLPFLVCGIFFGSLSPERHWAAKGGQNPQVNPPSTGISPVRCRTCRGTAGPPRAWQLFSLFPSVVATKGSGGGAGLAALFGSHHVGPWKQMLAEQPGILAWSPGTKCPLPPCQKGSTGIEAGGQSRAQPQWDSQTPQNSQRPEGQ